MSDVTRILEAIQAGQPQAASELLPLVYNELRQLAAAKVAQEKPGQTLDATALVHEAFLRLVGPGDEPHWDHRGHFFAAAAEAMRRILIENARRKRSVKHGGGRQRMDLDSACSLADAEATVDASTVDLLELDDALARLAQESPAKAELVKLRFFAGLTMQEAAQALGISLATAERYWTYARTWLFAELGDASQLELGEKKLKD